MIVSTGFAGVVLDRPEWLNHARWLGLTVYDFIFPLFVTLSGIGLAFAYRRSVSVAVTARRVVVLLVVGLVYNALMAGVVDPATLRYTGTLQAYAVLVLVSALLHVRFKTSGAWAVITLLLGLVYTVVLLGYARSCPGAALTPECNPSLALDSWLFGPHMYSGGTRGHDPEGVVALLGVLTTASAGTTAGHLALDAREHGWSWGLGRLLAWTIALAVVGAALIQVLEPFKRLWTPPFALMAASLAVLLFAIAYILIDRPVRNAALGRVRAALVWPLQGVGRQSLLVYFGSRLTAALLQRHGGEVPYAQQWAERLAFLGGPQVGFALVFTSAWVALAMLLHAAKIYVHA